MSSFTLKCKPFRSQELDLPSGQSSVAAAVEQHLPILSFVLIYTNIIF